MAEKAYVIGHPVAHSKSPAMHNAAYRALGLYWNYDFKDCATEIAARVFIEARNWRACNVTMPWKPVAYDEADTRSVEADLAQGANVLVNWGGRLYADNTDGKGCIAYLQRCGAEFAGARLVVCGTGPTSLAIMHAGIRAGAADVTLLGRDAGKAQRVLASYSERAGEPPDAAIHAGAYSDEAAAIAAASIIVDATPLGMNPGDPAPFDTHLLSAGQVVFDVVYGHGETALGAGAREAGCAVHDGAGMLVAQAVETVRDIADITGAFAIPAHLDLFAIMAQAAEFDVA